MQQNDVGWPSAYLIRINTLYTLDDFPHLWAREKIIVVHNVPLDIRLCATAANTRRCEIKRSEEGGCGLHFMQVRPHILVLYGVFNERSYAALWRAECITHTEKQCAVVSEL